MDGMTSQNHVFVLQLHLNFPQLEQYLGVFWHLEDAKKSCAQELVWKVSEQDEQVIWANAGESPSMTWTITKLDVR